ncbi:hypothetical protein [Cryptosporangium japonicum]
MAAAAGARSPHRDEDSSGGTVRALTAALAPHLSTADPELHGLAATLLTAQQDYALSISDAPGAVRDQACQRFSEAAHDYCRALDQRGLALPPGLLETVEWLTDRTAVTDAR